MFHCPWPWAAPDAHHSGQALSTVSGKKKMGGPGGMGVKGWGWVGVGVGVAGLLHGRNLSMECIRS